MSGSGGNAFLDFLRVLAPANVPRWALVLLAAFTSTAVVIALVRFNEFVCLRLQHKFSSPIQSRSPALLALAGSFAALAAYPFAPHVFVADIEIGLFLILALMAVTTLGNPKRAAALVPLGLALVVPVLIGGTSNWIEASRLQSDWFGLGWFVFKNPFGLPALVLFCLAALELCQDGEHISLFLMSTLGVVFFFGGFESPLTWGLRQSLGLDPGFLNHVTLSDGSVQTHIAIGGLVFQTVCVATLIGKTMLGILLMMWLRSLPARGHLQHLLTAGSSTRASLALLCVFGAGLWECVRAALWSGVQNA